MTIELTHANDGEKMVFNTPMVFYWRHSQAQKCTILVSNAGAFAPVRESVEEVTTLVNQAGQAAQPQEEKHGI